MPRLLAAFAVLLLSTVPSFAAANGDAVEVPATLLMTDPLEELYVATYYTVEELTAQLPHGQLAVAHGVLASFVDVEARTAGVIVGDIELHLDRLPEGPSVLNLFRELGEDKYGVTRKASQAYYSVAVTADSHVEQGYVIALRSWDELFPSEQEEFIEIYLQAVSDGWVETDAASYGAHWAGGGQAGDASLKLRYPVGKEIFAAVWTDDGNRWDYRVNADASEFTVTDYNRNITYVQDPWAPEEGDLDEAIQFSKLDYHYSFQPPQGDGEMRQLGNVAVSILADFAVNKDSTSLGMVSYPWLDFAEITDESGTEYSSHRGGEGQSDWMLFVDGDFRVGETYQLSFVARGDVPDSYNGIGYGGVYRFDTVALWPGESHAAQISIDAEMPGEGWQGTASEGADLVHSERELASVSIEEYPPTEFAAEWPSTTRNQMIVATQFPSVSIPTSWGSWKLAHQRSLLAELAKWKALSLLVRLSPFITSCGVTVAWPRSRCSSFPMSTASRPSRTPGWSSFSVATARASR